MNNTLEHLAKITATKSGMLNHLFDRIKLVICDELVDDYLDGNNLSEFDLGFGKLQILITGDEVRYKFIPSKDFESMIVEAITSKESPLITVLEKTITEKIISTYKELL